MSFGLHFALWKRAVTCVRDWNPSDLSKENRAVGEIMFSLYLYPRNQYFHVAISNYFLQANRPCNYYSNHRVTPSNNFTCPIEQKSRHKSRGLGPSHVRSSLIVLIFVTLHSRNLRIIFRPSTTCQTISFLTMCSFVVIRQEGTLEIHTWSWELHGSVAGWLLQLTLTWIFLLAGPYLQYGKRLNMESNGFGD